MDNNGDKPLPQDKHVTDTVGNNDDKPWPKDEAIEDWLNRKPTGNWDIHLMYPCDFSGSKYVTSNPVKNENPDDDLKDIDDLIEHLKNANATDFSDDYFQMQRSVLGRCICSNSVEKCDNTESFEQQGIAYKSIHEKTKLGVVGIVFLGISCEPLRILQAFSARALYIDCGHASGRKLDIDKWLDDMGISICGMPKAVVFANKKDEVDIKDIVYCLACESYDKEFGLINSAQLSKLSGENIAQYEIAHVYVSSECLLEIENEPPKDKMKTQAAEVFFAELLLLQIAAIGKVCAAVVGHMGKPVEPSNYFLISLSNMMFDVVRFLDFNKFNYATTRYACQEISDRFGIPAEIQKYKQYREILEQMIILSSEERAKAADEQAKAADEQAKAADDNMSRLLLILAIVQVLPTLAGLFELIIMETLTMTTLLAWLGSITSCLILVILFFIHKKQMAKRLTNKYKRSPQE